MGSGIRCPGTGARPVEKNVLPAIAQLFRRVPYRVQSHVGVWKRGKAVSLVSQAELALRNTEKLGKLQAADKGSEFSTDCAAGR